MGAGWLRWRDGCGGGLFLFYFIDFVIFMMMMIMMMMMVVVGRMWRSLFSLLQYTR